MPNSNSLVDVRAASQERFGVLGFLKNGWKSSVSLAFVALLFGIVLADVEDSHFSSLSNACLALGAVATSFALMSLPSLVAHRWETTDSSTGKVLRLLVVETWTNIQWLFVACVGAVVVPFLPSPEDQWFTISSMLSFSENPRNLFVLPWFKASLSVYFFMLAVHRSRMLVTQSLSNLLALITASHTPNK